MMWLHMLVLAIAKMLSGQPVMLHVVDQFQLPHGDKGLQQEQAQTRKPTQRYRHAKHDKLHQDIPPKRISERRNGATSLPQAPGLNTPR